MCVCVRERERGGEEWPIYRGSVLDLIVVIRQKGAIINCEKTKICPHVFL